MEIKNTDKTIKQPVRLSGSGRYIRTEEHKRQSRINLGTGLLGKHHSAKTRLKLSILKIGRKCSPQTLEKLRKSHLGIIPSPESIAKGLATRKRNNHLKHSEGTKRKIGDANSGQIRLNVRGSNSCHWRGGVTPICKLIRNSPKYWEWRQTIFIRDDFTCQQCNQRGGRLHAHHKKSFKILTREAMTYLPLLNLFDASMQYTPLWDISNGITLCGRCHRKINAKQKN